MKLENFNHTWFIFISLFIFTFPIYGVTATNNEIVIALEEPTNDSIYSGVSNIRGWAIAPHGINHIELFIDGTFKTNIPSGGLRSDVGNSYPSFPNADQSGFSMAFNYSNLSLGSHTLLVRAVDTNADSKETIVTFNIARFEKSFIPDPTSIDISASTLMSDSKSISLKNLLADGKYYNIIMEWRPATQGFAITQITPASTEPSGKFSGTYKASLNFISENCNLLDPGDFQQQISRIYPLTQNGNNLSAGVLGLTGSVDPNGNFILDIFLGSHDLGNGCMGTNSIRDTGNFNDHNIEESYNYNFSDACSSELKNCSAIYRGTISLL